MLLTVCQITQILSGGLLIFLILIQLPKSGGMGIIGGMSQMFSSQSSANSWLVKSTTYTAGAFMLISLLIGTGVIK